MRGTLTPKRLVHILRHQPRFRRRHCHPRHHCHCRPHKILPKNQGHPQVNMFGNLEQQGDNHNSFDFFSGFQDDTEFGHDVDFLNAGFGADLTYHNPARLSTLSASLGVPVLTHHALVIIAQLSLNTSGLRILDPWMWAIP
jgi:hypothetical protein